MNKIIMGLIVAVCVLGMALIMLNERLGLKEDIPSEPARPSAVATPTAPLSGGLGSATPPVATDNVPMSPSLSAPALSSSQAEVSSYTHEAPTQRDLEQGFAFGGSEEGAPQLQEEPVPSPEGGYPPEPEDGVPPSSETAAPVTTPAEQRNVPVPSLSSLSESADSVANQEQELRSTDPLPELPALPPQNQPESVAPVVEKKKVQEEPKKEAPKPAESKKEEKQAKEASKPAEKKAAPKKAASKDKTIERFVVYVREKGATVRIVGNSQISYKPLILTKPDRVVVDLNGDWDIKAPGVPKNDIVTNVRIGKMSGKTRIVIDLKSKPDDVRHVLSKDRDQLDVRIDK